MRFHKQELTISEENFTNNKHSAYTYYYCGRCIGAGITGTI